MEWIIISAITLFTVIGISKKIRRAKSTNFIKPVEYDEIQYPSDIGERSIYAEIKYFDNNAKIIHNAYIPIGNGYFSEIDLIYINHCGIIVIESKNYSGSIYGDENREYWSQYFKTKNGKFYNPIKQNQKHINHLRRYLDRYDTGPYLKCHSVIVFGNMSELRNVYFTSPDVYVINEWNLNDLLCILSEINEHILSEFQVNDIYQRLFLTSQRTDEFKMKHVANVQEYLKLCPLCRNKLVERVNTMSNSTMFYGCSAFPRCKYTRSIEYNQYSRYN